MAGTPPSLFVRGSSGMQRLVLGTAIDSGEFGEVHALAGSHRGLAVKLYKRNETAAENDSKISWMIGLKPPLLEQQHAGRTYYQLAWPKERVFNGSNRFVGFTMPEVDVAHAVNLEWIIGEDNRRAKNIPQHYSFRLHVAWNLAAVFASLHKSGVCVIDVKPDNILFYQDVGFVCLLDCDSFIPTDKRQPAIGAGCTLGYILPEARRRADDYAPDDYREEQDKFALSVLIFRLMNEGIHPYQGQITDSGLAARGLELQSRIDLGLYPYGLAPNPHIKPAFQSRHDWFDVSTRQLFDRAFSSKHRPTAREWADHLAEYVGPSATRLHKCKLKPKEHVHFSKGCGACFAEARLGKLKARRPAKGTHAAKPIPPPTTTGRPAPGPAPPSPPPPRPIPVGAIIGWGVGLLILLNVVSCVREFVDDISRPSSETPSSSPRPVPYTREEPYSPPYNANPSFPCSGDLSWQQRAICSDEALAAQDRELAEVSERLSGSADPEQLRRINDRWREEWDRCGGSGDIPACLGWVYREWLEALREASPTAQPDRGAEVAAPNPEPTPEVRRQEPTIEGPATVPERDEVRRPRPAERAEPRTREYVQPAPGVTCVLPSGQEMRLSYDECRARAGVVYE